MNEEAKKFAIETVGCRLNQYESEKMADQLIRAGLKRVVFDNNADIYLINTCTVTGRADASCRNIISRVARSHKDAAVIVIGCYVDSDAEKVARLYGVDLAVKNIEKENIAGIIKNHFPDLLDNATPLLTSPGISEFYKHNRAWVKIGDGCNQRCAYCIVPHVRGGLVNRRAEEIAGEITLLSKNGYHEVVLTGVHVGQYHQGTLRSIADLIKYLLNSTDISRLRLSSIEPQEVNEDLILAMKNAGHRICRHLHIPLQSGSDKILNAMRRPYTAEKYLATLNAVRENIDGIVLGADIMVGFPGESESDFAESVKVAESGFLDYFHLFSYSDRPGTESSAMSNKIDPGIIKSRVSILRRISDDLYAAALKREVGRTVHAISEHRFNKRGNNYLGITDNYLKITIPDFLGGGREILKLKASSSDAKQLIGSI